MTITLKTGLTVAGWVVSVLLAYGAVKMDVAVLQSQVEHIYDSLARIEAKVDQLLMRPK